MVKLANNTFRDISFAFANELALLGGKFNVDSNHLIGVANEGYPRSNIPILAQALEDIVLLRIHGCIIFHILKKVQ